MPILNDIRTKPPLIVCITNDVVKNFTANGLIAMGASPIMSGEKSEAPALMKAAEGLLINIGTADEGKKPLMAEMVKEANKNDVPVILDPVGYAASAFRKNLVDDLIAQHDISLIKGNKSEIMALAGMENTSRGVDSTETSDSLEIAEAAFQKLNIPVVVTGEADAIITESDKSTLHNGHEMLGKITGSGCLLGGVILAFLARGSNASDAVSDAVSYYNLCAESAVENNAEGPGTFHANFIDALYLNNDETLNRKVVKNHD